jgi:predicted permease
VLPTLGVSPHLGRWFSPGDDSPGTPETAILGYGYWQRRFGGDPRVLGRTVTVNFVPREVIGVMPQDFRFLHLSPDVFLPQRFPAGGLRPDVFSYSGLARLARGITPAAANRDTARVWKGWSETDPRIARFVAQLQVEPSLRPLEQDVIGDIARPLNIVMGALGLVLVLVCANVANLLLIRTHVRRHELGIRSALGASAGRIARELLVESLTLGALGGVFGLLLAYTAVRVLVSQGPATLPRLGDISIDRWVLAFVVACSLAVSLVCGLPAVVQGAFRRRLENARGSTADARQVRAQHALVVVQVALALVLLVGSGLMIRTFVALRGVAPGFTSPGQIQTVRIVIPEGLTPDPERVIRMQADIVSRLEAVPGVKTVGFASGLPMEPEHRNGMVIAVEGQTRPNEMPPNRVVVHVSPGLLAAQGTRLIAGRDFTWEDVLGQRPLAMVSENMARETWGGAAQALGKRIRLGRDGALTEVIGVVENVYRDGADKPAPATVYARAGVVPPTLPGGSAAVRRAVTFAIRSERAGSAAFVREVSSAVHAVNANLPLAKVRTLADVYRQSTARTSFALVLLGIAAAISLTIAVVGVYGVLAYAVARRRHELGIRVALGARPAMVTALFLRQGLLLACIGATLGLASAAALSRWMASLLFGVTPGDPLTLLAAAGVIAAASLAASYLPARQASRVDPLETLRRV